MLTGNIFAMLGAETRLEVSCLCVRVMLSPVLQPQAAPALNRRYLWHSLQHYEWDLPAGVPGQRRNGFRPSVCGGLGAGRPT